MWAESGAGQGSVVYFWAAFPVEVSFLCVPGAPAARKEL
jgi:hypothetical protein